MKRLSRGEEPGASPGDNEIVLVLDDYHLVRAQQVHTSLAFLLEHLPAGLHLVLASRSDPPLPLARLRARRQLTELRTEELRFTAEEAAALLRESAGRAASMLVNIPVMMALHHSFLA